jgi:uncharacterized integral membrane protein
MLLDDRSGCSAAASSRLRKGIIGFVSGGKPMRFIQAVVFLVFLGAVACFAVQNTQVVTVQFMKWSVSAPVALTILSVYLLGMLSGWTVVAFVGRSIRRIGESDR